MKQQLLILILCVSNSLQGVSDYTKNFLVEIHELDILKAVDASVLTLPRDTSIEIS